VTIWSLVTGTATYIQFPKHPDRGQLPTQVVFGFAANDIIGYAYRKDGRYFILAERHRSKDTIGVYDASEGYKLSRVGLFLPL